jgi:hypothetical protein
MMAGTEAVNGWNRCSHMHVSAEAAQVSSTTLPCSR